MGLYDDVLAMDNDSNFLKFKNWNLSNCSEPTDIDSWKQAMDDFDNLNSDIIKEEISKIGL